MGIEPTNKGFADLSLTTWVPRPEDRSIAKVGGCFSRGRRKVNGCKARAVRRPMGARAAALKAAGYFKPGAYLMRS